MHRLPLHTCRVRQLSMTSQPSFAAAVKSSIATVDSRRDYAQSNAQSVKRKAARQARKESQTPQTEVEEENVYILTFLTDQAHQDQMTALRDRYFPPHLNKLPAHITLFHALPGSKLESVIIPRIEEVASRTPPFTITMKGRKKQVQRLGKGGVAITIEDGLGGKKAKRVRHELQAPWREMEMLSHQDTRGSGMFPHYTITNKLDQGKSKKEYDAEVKEVKEKLRNEYVNSEGVVEGLGLWLYDRGGWQWVRRFDFLGSPDVEKEESAA